MYLIPMLITLSKLNFEYTLVTLIRLNVSVIQLDKITFKIKSLKKLFSVFTSKQNGILFSVQITLLSIEIQILSYPFEKSNRAPAVFLQLQKNNSLLNKNL